MKPKPTPFHRDPTKYTSPTQPSPAHSEKEKKNPSHKPSPYSKKTTNLAQQQGTPKNPSTFNHAKTAHNYVEPDPARATTFQPMPLSSKAGKRNHTMKVDDDGTDEDDDAAPPSWTKKRG
jgi:hypothetical protein